MNIPGINNMPQFYQPYTRPQTNGINWVQGLEGAKAFQLTPNSNIVLMDSENEHFYIKTCDNIGMCDLRIFSYTEITNEPTVETKYMTKEDVEALVNQILKENRYVKQSVQPAKQSNNKHLISE